MSTVLHSIVMTEMHAHETARGGVAWTGVLRRDGSPLLRVSNDGNGGCNDYHPFPGVDRRVIDELEQAAREATGMRREALDMLTAYMEDGDNAAQHVAEVRASVTS